MSEQYMAELTSPKLPEACEFSALYDDDQGLRVLIRSSEDEKRVFCIHFEYRKAYRVTDEGDRLASMNALRGKADVGLCRVENSDWLAWFLQESLNIPAKQRLEHWAVVTTDEIVDVIAVDPPKIFMM